MAQSKPTKSKKSWRESSYWNGNGIAFLPIGITFIILGLNDQTAFVALGIVFIILSFALSYGQEGESSGTKPSSDASGDTDDGIESEDEQGRPK